MRSCDMRFANYDLSGTCAPASFTREIARGKWSVLFTWLQFSSHSPPRSHRSGRSPCACRSTRSIRCLYRNRPPQPGGMHCHVEHDAAGRHDARGRIGSFLMSRQRFLELPQSARGDDPHAASRPRELRGLTNDFIIHKSLGTGLCQLVPTCSSAVSADTFAT